MSHFIEVEDRSKSMIKNGHDESRPYRKTKRDFLAKRARDRSASKSTTDLDKDSHRDLKIKSKSEECLFYRDFKKRPAFCTQLMDRTAAEGSAIKLTCSVIGSDIETAWYRNDVLLNNSHNYRIIESDSLHTLEIFSVSPEDSGEYTCVASNNYGEVFTFSHLKVYAGYEALPMSPTFTRPIKGIIFYIFIFNND